MAIVMLGCASVSRSAPVGPLGDTVHLTEITSDNERIAVTGGGVTDVDINSRIEVRVDRARVGEAMVGEAHDESSTDAIAQVKKQLVDLVDLTRRQRLQVSRVTAHTKEWLASGSLKVPDASFQVVTRQISVEQLALNDAIRKYADASQLDPGSFFALPGADGTARALDAERRKVLEAAVKLASGTPLRWRMQAMFARGDQIHLENYDAAPDAPFAVVDKLAPQMSDRQRAAQFEEAKQLARELKDLSSATDALRTAGRSALQSFLEQLQTALQGDYDALVALVHGLPETLPAEIRGIAEVRAVETALDSVFATIGTIRNDCAPVITVIQAGSLASIPPLVVTTCTRSVLEEFPVLVRQAEQAAVATRALAKAAETNPDKFKPVRMLVEELKTTEKIRSWSHDERWQRLMELLGLTSQNTTPVDWRTELQTDRVMRDITDSTLDLRRTARKEGDLFYFRPSISNQDGSTVVAGATSDFRVVRMGVYLDVSAGVSFVDKRDHAWGPFDASPEILAALHYRWRPNSALWRTLNLLRPGIGMHFMYPDLGAKEIDPTTMVVTDKDAAFELGVGGTFTLFGDLLQIGAGYDLQAQVSYWYVGFGLQTLANLGVRFSPGN
jgi:hypothetical protein